MTSSVDILEKALEGVTPGPWHDAPGTATGRIVVAPNTTKARRRIAAIGGPDRDSNAAYIAACSPDRMREILALARKAEAMEREMAALLDAEALSGIRALVAGWNGEHLPETERFGRHHDELGVKLPTTCGAIYALDEAMTRARALLGGSNANE